MIRNLPRDGVEGLPSGLCACRLDGEEKSIAAISPTVLWLRADRPLHAASITLYFYRPETGGYISHTLKEVQTGSVQHENSAVLTRFCFDDPACAAEIRRMLNSYARYLETRSLEGAAAYASMVSGYPEEKDDIFASSPRQQRAQWFENLPPLPEVPENCSLALELNCRDLWKLYLRHPLETFMEAYAAAQNLPGNRLPRRSPDRIYIGNAFCSRVFPEDELLHAIAEKAEREGIALTLLTAELRCGQESAADAQIEFALAHQAEICINDWGMLQRAQNRPKRPAMLLGAQLNRRRKDPRMGYKSGLKGREELLAENSLNDPGWIEFLRSMGISRFEYESCGYGQTLPDAPCSLHLPFYQTNTALWCPLKALCEGGSRGAQTPSDGCPGWCEGNELIYPDHLQMTGRWNSLLALDAAPDAAFMRKFDRWVLNF